MMVIQRDLEALLELQLCPLRLQPPIKLILSNCSETPGRDEKPIRQAGGQHSHINIIPVGDQAEEVSLGCL